MDHAHRHRRHRLLRCHLRDGQRWRAWSPPGLAQRQRRRTGAQPGRHRLPRRQEGPERKRLLQRFGPHAGATAGDHQQLPLPPALPARSPADTGADASAQNATEGHASGARPCASADLVRFIELPLWHGGHRRSGSRSRQADQLRGVWSEEGPARSGGAGTAGSVPGARATDTADVLQGTKPVSLEATLRSAEGPGRLRRPLSAVST